MPLGISFPGLAWANLNCFQTGIGLFHSEMHKWGMASMTACECGASKQTAEHIQMNPVNLIANLPSLITTFCVYLKVVKKTAF